jgi:hypothetical protein
MNRPGGGMMSGRNNTRKPLPIPTTQAPLPPPKPQRRVSTCIQPYSPFKTSSVQLADGLNYEGGLFHIKNNFLERYKKLLAEMKQQEQKMQALQNKCSTLEAAKAEQKRKIKILLQREKKEGDESISLSEDVESVEAPDVAVLVISLKDESTDSAGEPKATLVGIEEAKESEEGGADSSYRKRSSKRQSSRSKKSRTKTLKDTK